jgi:hypothetical protein
MLRRTAIAVTLLVAAPCFASNNPAIEAAKTTAAGWLRLVDAQDIEGSWERTSSAFKSAVTVAQWSQALASVRRPLGALRQREVKAEEFKTSLPGAPDGKYVLLQYQSTFENKAAAVETVTVVLDPDGAWKVVGYFIR